MDLTLPFWFNFVHPAIMWVLLFVSLYALYLGVQAKRTRTAPAEERKELVKEKFNVKHYQVGSVLLALLTLGLLGGMAVTYINNGKLFVGPHLLVGLGMTGLVGVSASMSPFMQQGKDWARAIHILLNLTVVALFFWQAATGVQIVLKILDNA